MKFILTIGVFIILSTYSGPSIGEEEADSLSLGDPLKPPKIGEPYVVDKIGDWSLECMRNQDGFETCEMVQLLLNKQKQPMSEISLFRLSNNQGIAAGANIIVVLPYYIAVNNLGENKNYDYYRYSLVAPFWFGLFNILSFIIAKKYNLWGGGM